MATRGPLSPLSIVGHGVASAAMMKHPAFTVVPKAQPCPNTTDPVAKFDFSPAPGSDELFFALRTAYPLVESHRERMISAVMDFYERAQPSHGSPTSQSRLTNFTTAALEQPDNGILASMAAPSDNGDQSGVSSGQQPPSHRHAMHAMMQSFAFQGHNSSTARSKRPMTDQEKDRYRFMKKEGACLDCRKKKRRCSHKLATERDESSTLKRRKLSDCDPTAATTSLVTRSSEADTSYVVRRQTPDAISASALATGDAPEPFRFPTGSDLLENLLPGTTQPPLENTDSSLDPSLPDLLSSPFDMDFAASGTGADNGDNYDLLQSLSVPALENAVADPHTLDWSRFNSLIPSPLTFDHSGNALPPTAPLMSLDFSKIEPLVLEADSVTPVSSAATPDDVEWVPRKFDNRRITEPQPTEISKPGTGSTFLDILRLLSGVTRRSRSDPCHTTGTCPSPDLTSQDHISYLFEGFGHSVATWENIQAPDLQEILDFPDGGNGRYILYDKLASKAWVFGDKVVNNSSMLLNVIQRMRALSKKRRPP